MSEGSKPWWQWISKDDLRLLREHVQRRKPKRNSLELARDSSLMEGGEKKKSILRKPSMQPETDNDTQCNDGNQVEFNGAFVESDTKVKTKEEIDYAYHGYTLEITDKVRLVPLNSTNPNNRKHNRRVSFHQSCIRMDSD